MTCTSTFGIIICKFSYYYLHYKIGMFLIDKGCKIYFYYTILSFSLAIYL